MIVMLAKARLAFPNLFEAKAFAGSGDPAYSATFIVPGGDPQLAAINTAIAGVAKAKWGAKADAMLKAIQAKGDIAFRDGATKAEYEGFDGNWYVAARNKVRPLILDRDTAPLVAADGRPYGGCFVNAKVEFWAQDNGYGKRLNAALLAVQFHSDGDSFGGGARPSPEGFADLSQGVEAEFA